ncbi:MAG: hypothetical protein AAGF50_15420, partial [Pseudomonadota bacterium]
RFNLLGFKFCDQVHLNAPYFYLRCAAAFLAPQSSVSSIGSAGMRPPEVRSTLPIFLCRELDHGVREKRPSQTGPVRRSCQGVWQGAVQNGKRPAIATIPSKRRIDPRQFTIKSESLGFGDIRALAKAR